MDWNDSVDGFGDNASDADIANREFLLQLRRAPQNTVLQTQVQLFVEQRREQGLTFANVEELAIEFSLKKLKKVARQKVLRLEVRDEKDRVVHSQDIKWENPSKSLQMLVRQITGIKPPIALG
jgi:hypothetical protein